MKRITKSKLKEIYHKIDNRIINHINKLDSSVPNIAASHPNLAETSDRGYKKLIGVARRYDIEDFFVLSMDKARRDMKTRYKVLLKGYQGARDGGVAVVKKIYKLRYDR